MTFSKMIGLSFTMPVLLLLSILVLAAGLERLFVFWVARSLPSRFWRKVKQALERGDLGGAVDLCRLSSSPIHQAFERMLQIPDADTEKLVETFQLYRQRLQMDLSRRVGFFGTASFVSPLIGLMGTVLGIMRAFHDLAGAGAGGPAVVAAGISEALVTTATGIGVAVMSALFYNYFTLSARYQLNTVDMWVFELSQLLEPGRPRARAGSATTAPMIGQPLPAQPGQQAPFPMQMPRGL